MLEGQHIQVIIPALNEQASIGHVLGDVPGWVDRVVVVDNGSTDATADVARAAGATVVREDRRGYGQACLGGMAAVGWCDIVVFLDGDYSDFPEQMDRLVGPILADQADMVLGRRCPVHDEPVFTGPQRFGTALACHLMRIGWNGRYRDMGPFRAIRWPSLQALSMCDTTYGWTVEMQIKALLAGLRVREVDVDYRRRIGTSKISGTLRGVVGAGTKIVGTIGRYALAPPVCRQGAAERLIVFGRWPRPGQTKTRLIPALGPLGAAELQRRLTLHAVEQARTCAAGRCADIEFRHSGGSAGDLRAWLGPGLGYRPQVTGGLGRRMGGAIRQAFAQGCRRVVLFGTDVPGCTAVHLETALDALRTTDVVLGPVTDGGYWLIGLRRPADLFSGIPWSTDRVLTDTLRLAEAQGLSVHSLETLSDVDEPQDLPLAEPLTGEPRPVLSVVIPTLNEQGHIEATLAAARCEGAELIVADGGSTDRTVGLAERAGARVVAAPPGRARQQNAGAALAQADILLFLHADTRLPPDYAARVFETMLDTRAVGGGFLWRTDLNHPLMRVAERFVTWRTRYRNEPWGDQAIFVRRPVFERLGGFADLPIAEDWHFVRRLRSLGRMAAIEAPVITSARRWQRVGVLRTFAINWAIIAGLRVGLPGHWLARLY